MFLLLFLRECVGYQARLFSGNREFSRKILNYQRMLFFIILESKEFCFLGYYFGFIYLVILLKMSLEMKNKVVIKSFIIVYVQQLF